MPRKESKAAPEGNGPAPQQQKFESGQPTRVDIYRMIEELPDESDRKLDELADEMRGIRQRETSLEQNTRQPRLAMGANRPAYTNTRERANGAARTVKAMYADSFSVNRVDPDPMCSTSFGVKAEPTTLPCRDDVLVENGAAAPK